MLVLLSALSPAFHAPLGGGPAVSHRRPRRVLASVASDYEIKPAKGTEESLGAAAEFFVDGFWLSGTTTDEVKLSAKERTQLASLSCDDMMGRYGELVGQRRLRSKLFVARDSAGDIVGCVGVEAAMVDMVERRVLSRAQGEAVFAAEFAAMGGAERGVYRGLPLSEIVEELVPEYKIFGLLANLAVAPSTRRSGLARRLCAKCDEAAASWDLPAISLQAASAGKAIALTTGLWSARGRRRLPGPSEGWELAYAPRSAASTAGGLAVVALAAPPRAAPTTRLSRASRPQVDGANAAARGLYESVGYGEIWRDETTALRLRPGAADLLASEPSTLITMAKGL